MAAMRWAGLIALLGALLAACAPPLPVQAPAVFAPLPADFPAAHYRQAAARGAEVLRVDPQRSLVVIEVRRAGALAGLGHDHVVASHDVGGFVIEAEGRADIHVALDRLVVDESALRSAAGFDTQPSDEAIAGTRRNMLEKALETERFPFALIRATRVDAERPGLSVAITLHGATRTFNVPAQIETLRDGIAVGGRMTFNQTDFGIVPYSVFGGALQVRDRLDLRFRILAAESGNRPHTGGSHCRPISPTIEQKCTT